MLARHEPRDRLDPNEYGKISNVSPTTADPNPTQVPRSTAAYRRRKALAARALELHREGRDILEIAKEMEISASRAASLLTFALEKLPGFDDAELVALSDARLDSLAAVFRRSLDSDDEKIRMQAAESLRRLEADRARLIQLGMKT
jgi:hypothetical protein